MRFIRLIACVLLAMPALGQSPWTGILDASRATDWTQAGIPGGIPTYSTTCQAVALQAGSANAAANSTAIQNAMNACSGTGQAVLLPAGTWYVAGILPNASLQQEVLRGAGPLATTLLFTSTVGTSPVSDIRIKGAGGTLNSTTWTGGYSQGSTVLTVGSTAGFSTTPGATGNLIILDQRNDDIGVVTNGESETGSVATITTSIAHGFSNGNTVTIGQQWGATQGAQGWVNSGYHGVWPISAAGPCASCGSGGAALTSSQFQFNETGTCTITNATWASSTATINIDCGKQWLIPGDSLVITGASPSGYNGTYTAATATFTGGAILTATYALASNPGGTSTIGSVSWTRSGLAAGPAAKTDYVGKDTGGVFVCDIGNGCNTDNNTYLGQNCTGTVSQLVAACQAGEISRRSQQEVKQVTAIDAVHGTITVDPPLELTNWRSANAPGIWWNTTTAYRVGIENMTLDYLNDGLIGSTGIAFSQASQCWIKNIRGFHAGLAQVMMEYGSARNEVLDSYFYGLKHAGNKAYGVNLYSGSSDNLIQNNIFQGVEVAMLEQDVGSVVAYNYQIMGQEGSKNLGFLGAAVYGNHGVDAAELYEGNNGNAYTSDNIHGGSQTLTFFRNRLRGQDTPSNNSHLIAAADRAFNRVENFIGNVLGTTGLQTTYQTTANDPVFPSGYVYDIGGTGNNGNAIQNDVVVLNSLLRWGNYDVATGATRWCGNSSSTGWSTTCASASEIPTSGVAFINGNPVPTVGDTVAGQAALPNSFYLAAQPYFWVTPWGTPSWPAIGPDVSGGTATDTVAGHSNAIPSQLCYDNSAIDSAYQDSYTVTNASYSGTTVTLTIGTHVIPQYETIVVSGITPSGYNGTYQVIAVTATTVSYSLPSNPGAYSSGGTVTYPNIIAFDASNCYTSTQTPGAFFNPPVMGFAGQVVNTTSAGLTTVLANNGTATLTINSLTLQTGTRFAISANTCGGTLAAGASCSVTITFTPNALAAFTDALVLTSNASPQSVGINGTGIGSPGPLPLAIAPYLF